MACCAAMAAVLGVMRNVPVQDLPPSASMHAQEFFEKDMGIELRMTPNYEVRKGLAARQRASSRSEPSCML